MFSRLLGRGGGQKQFNHVAVSLEGDDTEYIKKSKLDENQLAIRKGKILSELLDAQTKFDIPILSVFLLSGKRVGTDFSSKVKYFNKVLDSLSFEFLHKNQIKVSPIGKWYELPNELVDTIKRLIDETKDYDRFFLNLCVYYTGQSELVDAARMIARRIKKGMLTPEDITKQTIKEDLYSSHFLAPELMIINDSCKLNGFMLWDSSDACIHFTKIPWPNFSGSEFRRIINEYPTRHIKTKAI